MDRLGRLTGIDTTFPYKIHLSKGTLCKSDGVGFSDQPLDNETLRLLDDVTRSSDKLLWLIYNRGNSLNLPDAIKGSISEE